MDNEYDKQLKIVLDPNTDTETLYNLFMHGNVEGDDDIDNQSELLISKTLFFEHPNFPYKLLEEYSSYLNLPIRTAIASNPSTNEELLKKLYHENKDDKYILEAVVKNPNTPLYILEELSELDDAYILSSIELHVYSPDELIAKCIFKQKEMTRIREYNYFLTIFNLKNNKVDSIHDIMKTESLEEAIDISKEKYNELGSDNVAIFVEQRDIKKIVFSLPSNIHQQYPELKPII